MSDAVKQILDEVTRRGLILVHDQVLPSATGLIAGGPVSGSWWSHPQANTIYNALGAIEDRVATVKLVCKKNTLVSEALWADLVAIGASNDRWQLDPLTPDAIDLLAEVNSCDEPIVIDKSSRSAAKQIEERLLVWATEIHTESGHHVKAYGSWSRWSRLRNVTSHEKPEQARSRFEAVVADWPRACGSKIFPWPGAGDPGAHENPDLDGGSGSHRERVARPVQG